MKVEPYSIDWGAATADLFDRERQEAAHVINHELASVANRRRTIRFLKARIEWFRRQLPAQTAQVVLIDDRGQRLAEPERREIRTALVASGADVRFASENARHGV